MRHRVYGKKFSRDTNERTSLFRNLVSSLLTHGTIETSESKAKAIKGLVDKIINLAKSKNAQRLLQTFLTNKTLQERLVKEIVPKMQNRISGYTSMERLGKRLGDGAVMVRMSLIGAEQLSSPSGARSSRSSDKGKSVVSKLVTSKQKTDNRKAKRTTSRRRVK